MLNRYRLLYNTVKFLKPIQINYRLYYFFRKKLRNTLGIKPIFSKKSSVQNLKLQESIHIADCYTKPNKFKFLNLEKEFIDKIDWNYSEYGKLWTYNLTYFDYLSQSDSREQLFLLQNFIAQIDTIKDGLEPFPISLRGINWIKYISYNKIDNKTINDSLYAQYYLLLDNLEYHLLGNHLLENGFSLLFGAYYFQDEVLYKKAKKILEKELDEQILKDGGHFELSPMYHQIMLFRLLDCINLVKHNSWKDDYLLKFLFSKAQIMLGWLESISYKNGDIPLFNDSTNGIAPTTDQLFEYAHRLNIERKEVELKESGYRKISKANYECIVDIGEIGASYIPGHAHADTFNFELRIKGKPFIVDMGLSTYETNSRRVIERSTASHNTVEVNSQNQSEVWGGFRVGERANIIEIKETKDSIEATHDGYKPILHTRKWTFEEHRIIIEDSLNKSSNAIVSFHFHPNVKKEEILTHFGSKNLNINFNEYYYSSEFNREMKSLSIKFDFRKSMKVEIKV